MSERLTAIYRGKAVCAFDLWDENHQYIEEFRSKLREASQSGELICPDCNSRLILCAGAIRDPYFRHFELKECHITFELKTKAGQRSYHCRRLLYDIAKRGKSDTLQLEESNAAKLKPVLFEISGKKYGFVYLEGKTRNYRELRDANIQYIKAGYRLFYFLPLMHQSQGFNITSDEAEIAGLNKGMLYYIDWEQGVISFRKRYEDAEHIARYYTQNYAAADLKVDENGEISAAFMKSYNHAVREAKLQFTKVLRQEAEDGLDEIYESMDYVLMDALGEIWVLPAFQYEAADVAAAHDNRITYLQQMNERMYERGNNREALAYTVQRQIETHRNSWDWV